METTDKIVLLIDAVGVPIILVLAVVVWLGGMWCVMRMLNIYREWGNEYQQKANELAKERHKLMSEAERYGGIWDNYVVKALCTAVAAAIIFIGAAIYASKKYDFNITPDNIVLTFVGIIATFLVITNYAQVIDIKRDFHRRVTKLEEKRRRLDNKITNSSRFDNNHVSKERQANREEAPSYNATINTQNKRIGKK